MFLDAPASEEINFQSMNLVTNHQNIINHNHLLTFVKKNKKIKH
jgi:hypothetical protein